jgi:hypothetical protein
MNRLGWLALALFTACGPQELPVADDALDDSAAQEVGAEWRVRTSGTTVWLDPTLTTAKRNGRDVYLVHGRASRNVSDVFSFVPDDAFGTAAATGPRTFEVALDAGGEMNSIAAGARLLIRLTAQGAPGTFTVGVTFAPKLEVQAGTSRIFIHPEITPVLVGGYTRYRATASTTSGSALTSVSNAEGSGPALTKVGARTWRLEWAPESLIKAGHPSTEALTFIASSAAGALSRQASIKFAVSSLGLTTADPYDFWKPAACKPAVKACLVTLAGAPDTELCGTAMEVTRCQAELRLSISPAAFATALKAHLATWYAQHGADVAAANGNTLAQAQAAVSEAKVTEAAEDPHGHDLGAVRVFSHPDVTFPGSDTVWFGAYDRLSGALLEVYDFN